MFLVTGGAGFIGSNVVASLNEAGASDVVVNDLLGKDDAKWRNLAKRQVADLVPPAELMAWLDGRKLDAVIHMGAISDTTATDGDLVMENNFRLSLRLLDWCTATRTPFIYASSAATYGDGGEGFDDDWSLEALRKLKPMNLYGWSKHLFDLAVVDRYVKKQKLPPHWVGLKFFNVYGPNEYHKGHMASVLAKVFDEAKAGKPVRLFKSHREGIADGDQRRDFIYVDDAVAVLRWLLDASLGQRHLQCRHRQGGKLPRHDRRHVQGARPAGQYRIYRHARRDPRPVPVFHGKYGREPAPRRLQCRLHSARDRRRPIRHRLSRPGRQVQIAMHCLSRRNSPFVPAQAGTQGPNILAPAFVTLDSRIGERTLAVRRAMRGNERS